MALASLGPYICPHCSQSAGHAQRVKYEGTHAIVLGIVCQTCQHTWVVTSFSTERPYSDAFLWVSH